MTPKGNGSSVFIGEMVHYVSQVQATSVCRAAIVTDRAQLGGQTEALGIVSLAVLHPRGMEFVRQVPYAEGRSAPGTWHFLCKV